ncbi:MAG: hypothetical protein RSC35_00765, partial [Mucinivorans sp.]
QTAGRATARCQRRERQIAVQVPCRIVTFEKVTQNFLGKTAFFLTSSWKLRFSEPARKKFVFLNQFLKTSFFLTALENCVFLNLFQVIFENHTKLNAKITLPNNSNSTQIKTHR